MGNTTSCCVSSSPKHRRNNHSRLEPYRPEPELSRVDTSCNLQHISDRENLDGEMQNPGQKSTHRASHAGFSLIYCTFFSLFEHSGLVSFSFSLTSRLKCCHSVSLSDTPTRKDPIVSCACPLKTNKMFLWHFFLVLFRSSSELF